MKKQLLLLSIFINVSPMCGMSHAISLTSIVAALHENEKKFLKDGSWQTINETQALLAKQYTDYTWGMKTTSADECKAYISNDRDYINRILYENNFQLQLGRLEVNNFSIISVVRFLCTWKKRGERTQVTYNNKKYSAVKIEHEWKNSGYTITQSNLHTVMHLLTNNGDDVSLVVADKERSGFDLLKAVMQIDACEYRDVTTEYENVMFPMVNLIHQPDISWLVGMHGLNNDNITMTLEHALQQINMQMSTHGIYAQDHVTNGYRKSLIINNPFFAWIKRPGIKLPLLAAYIHPNDWKQPNRD